jgi:hypothetical protein
MAFTIIEGKTPFQAEQALAPKKADTGSLGTLCRNGKIQNISMRPAFKAKAYSSN